MTDEKMYFVYFLMAGLAIMAVLFLISGATFVDEAVFTGTFLGSPVFVGTGIFDDVETVRASFDANNFIETRVFDLGARRIENGLLFGENLMKVDVGESEFTTVSFDVTNTNGLGDLIIKMDGEIIHKDDFAVGHYDFNIGPGRVLEIVPGSSNWRIWAPAIYDLQGIVVVTERFPREISTFTFGVDDPDEIDQFRADFFLASNAGSLIIRLNGDVVYDGALNTDQSVFLDPSRLNDVNIITFDAREDSRFSGRTTLSFTKKTEQEKEMIVDINLTQNEFNRFSRGEIAFDVVDVFSPGGYSIRIVNGNRVLLNEFVKLERGYFVFPIDRDTLGPGLNTVTIKAIDNAAFTIQGFTARL